MIMKRPLIVLLCASIVAPGCATTGARRTVPAPQAEQTAAGRAVLAEYVQQLPLGSMVRIDLAGGRVLRGTLMKAGNDSLIVQLRTRIPEPPIEIALVDVLRVTPEPRNGTSVGKMIGIGLAAGAAAALAFFMIVIATLDG